METGSKISRTILSTVLLIVLTFSPMISAFAADSCSLHCEKINLESNAKSTCCHENQNREDGIFASNCSGEMKDYLDAPSLMLQNDLNNSSHKNYSDGTVQSDFSNTKAASSKKENYSKKDLPAVWESIYLLNSAFLA